MNIVMQVKDIITKLYTNSVRYHLYSYDWKELLSNKWFPYTYYEISHKYRRRKRYSNANGCTIVHAKTVFPMGVTLSDVSDVSRYW